MAALLESLPTPASGSSQDSAAGSWYQKAARCRWLAQQALLPSAAAGICELRALGSDEDAAVREAAVRALGALGAQGGAEEARLALVEVAECESSGAVLTEALEALRVATRGAEEPTGTVHLRAAAVASQVVRTPTTTNNNNNNNNTVADLLVAALRLLEQVAAVDDAAVVSAVAARCKDSAPTVRTVAVQALAALSSGRVLLAVLAGDSAAASPLGSTRDPDWQVREAAVRALARVGARSPQARKAAAAASCDMHAAVRAAAAEALRHLAPQNDADCVSLLCDLCADSSSDVRGAALHSMRRAASRPDGSRPYAAVKACLECWENSWDGLLRQLALLTAAALAGRNDPEVVKCVARGLDSRDEELRMAAIAGMPLVGDGDDELVVAQLVRRLADCHPPVRRAALKALCEVVPVGNQVAVQLLVGRAGSPSIDVRLAVLDGLRQVACRGDATATEAVLERLDDAEARVRAAAVHTLADLAASCDSDEVITQVALRLEDVDPAVRASVSEALPHLASSGNRKVLQCLSHCCRSMRPPPHRESIREAACWALAKFAQKGDGQAIAVICESIDENYPQAAAGALRALVEVSLPGDLAAIDAAAAALAHKEQLTRDIALEVLEKLADRGAAAPPASLAAFAIVFEGSWTGGSIKGSKIFWNCDNQQVTPFELRGRSILSTSCVDSEGRTFPCWARLDAYGRLRWDFGEDWLRSTEPADSEELETTSLPALCGAALIPAKSPDELSPRLDAVAESQEVASEDVGDAYAVAAVAALLKSKDATVRQTAVVAVPRVAGRGCRAAIECLLQVMQDESVAVRLAAVESLAAVAQVGDTLAIEALRVRLEDQERAKESPSGKPVGPCVGMCAAKALKKLVTSREELVQIASKLKFTGPSMRGF
ncbi:unnamed protein product [Polarella glacialis]|uniref:Uncharacterized protein n=1 Tax=Polarella glacialis TaxID=89957 RepID=A0A813LMT4_POLGL|nr:unnamed protein product [Polarella glacialis]